MPYPTSSKGSHALVVEDDGLIRMDAVDILERAGYATLEAQTADQALDLLRRCHRDVTILFTDVRMPGTQDGFSLARETARTYPHIAILVSSGIARPVVGDMPALAHFIEKPFSARIVNRHLQQMIDENGLKVQ
ncbi:response regulator [Methylobacterium sp. Leaf94]|uniref:response regulator n=1 Tax=Methylobacterium sp. Leaf94 TaxID=1736250 RepID=UPI000AFE3CE4|nr:response regulator [Methylobacterium sp. Leaf94]